MEKGFVVFRNAIQVDKIKNSITDAVDYDVMNKFITESLVPTVNKNMDWDMQVTKYRVSNNNNSADASMFHRDIVVSKPVTPEIYTCLVYMDETTMELIPYSHTKPAMGYLEALTTFHKRERITVYPGDILLFNACVLHRGIFDGKIQSRRLLQLFDCFPNPSIRDQWRPKLIHILGDETFSDQMIKLSKTVFIHWLNYFGYLNAATGYGLGTEIPCLKEVEIFSSEGLRGRLEDKTSINKYVLLDKEAITLEDNTCRKKWKYVYYNRQYLIYSGVILVILCLLALMLLQLKRLPLNK